MNDTFFDTVDNLCNIFCAKPINWEAFDYALAEIEDINVYNEEHETTLLSEFLTEVEFSHDGIAQIEVIRHFLDNGYDVGKNDGRNGVLPLQELCWTSRDRYILDAAKLLLDAGASVACKALSDDMEKGLTTVIDTIEWKLPGAWVIDEDYVWANNLEAYYAIVKAAEEKKDFRKIDSYHACLGHRLCKVAFIPDDDDTRLRSEGDVTSFSGTLVLWFDEKPLTVSRCVELISDPIAVEENQNRLIEVNELFSDVIGASFVRLRYINQSTCCLDFDNGKRLIFSSFPKGENQRSGVFEVRAIDRTMLYEADVDSILRWNNPTYAQWVTTYDFASIALKTKDGQAYLLYPAENENHVWCIEYIKCSVDLLRDFTLRFSVAHSDCVNVFYCDNDICCVRFDCGRESLYVMPSAFRGLTVKLADVRIDPQDLDEIQALKGKCIAFAEENHLKGTCENQTAAEWIEDWLKEFPEDKGLVQRLRDLGDTDEQIKAFLEGI